jgi:8-amino-7-oxononanoate synthase
MGAGGGHLDGIINRILEDRREADLLRQRIANRPIDGVHVEIDGRVYVNFCSNNYLGLANHPKLISAMESTLREVGFGSSASGLISGQTIYHQSAERAIAAWKGAEAAVLLPSGYQANHAAVQTLAAIGKESRPVRFLVDRLCHASILDAVMSLDRRATVRVYPHNGMKKLGRLLAESDADVLNVVVTESIFSMDGDAADLDGLAALKSRTPFVLLLDEAHGSGVYGPAGAGYAAERGWQDIVDITIVTLSKALGAAGGAIVGSRAFCAAVVNFGRAYIYSTAIPAAAAVAAQTAIEILRDEPERQKRVRELARGVREEISNLEFQISDLRSQISDFRFEIPPGDSPIIPVILGTEKRALAAAEALRSEGLLVVAVRPPTVPPASSRLRVTLSSEHSDEDVSRLLAALAKVR